MNIRKILVSQPRPATERSPYFDMEKDYGVQIDFRQLIQVVGLNAREFRAQHINPLDYTAILFSSRLGVDHFFRLCQEMRLKVPEEMHYYCSSEQVGVYLQKYIMYRKRRVFFGENNKFEDVIPAMLRRPNEKFLLICSDVHNDDVVNMFAAHKIHIDTAVMYRTESVTIPHEEMLQYDIAVLFTPTGAQALHKNAPDFCQESERGIACFGVSTAAAVRELGWEPIIEAPSAKHPSITGALMSFLQEEIGED